MTEPRSRYWRASSGDGDSYQSMPAVEGLDAALDAIFELWGGPRRSTQTIRQALTAGGGNAYVMTEGGLVRLYRDDETTTTQALASKQDDLGDGRLRAFYVRALINAVDKDGGYVVFERNFSGHGLMAALGLAMADISTAIGGLPSCMAYASCVAREKTWRMQLSRGRGTTTVNFPATNDAEAATYGDTATKVFLVDGKSYFAILTLSVEPFSAAQTEKPTVLGNWKRR